MYCIQLLFSVSTLKFKESKMRMIKYLGIFFAIVCLMSSGVRAGNLDDNFVNDPTPVDELNEQLSTLTGALTSVISNKVPAALLQQAKAVGVAKVKKGGFLVALEGGQGMLMVRNGMQWSNPACIQLSSASFGWQAGIETKTVVLVFTKREAVGNLEGAMKFGAGLDLSVGPLAADIGTNMVFDKDVYTYSEGMGLFAGLSLEGSSMGFDPLCNEGLYGRKVTANEVLSDRTQPQRGVSAGVANLKNVLDKAL
jgi:lipid-binding SYLF domain-containing protein